MKSILSCWNASAQSRGITLSIEKRSDVDVGGRSIYSYFCFRVPISVDHHQCHQQYTEWPRRSSHRLASFELSNQDLGDGDNLRKRVRWRLEPSGSLRGKHSLWVKFQQRYQNSHRIFHNILFFRESRQFCSSQNSPIESADYRGHHLRVSLGAKGLPKLPCRFSYYRTPQYRKLNPAVNESTFCFVRSRPP